MKSINSQNKILSNFGAEGKYPHEELTLKRKLTWDPNTAITIINKN